MRYEGVVAFSFFSRWIFCFWAMSIMMFARLPLHEVFLRFPCNCNLHKSSTNRVHKVFIPLKRDSCRAPPALRGHSETGESAGYTPVPACRMSVSIYLSCPKTTYVSFRLCSMLCTIVDFLLITWPSQMFWFSYSSMLTDIFEGFPYLGV